MDLHKPWVLNITLINGRIINFFVLSKVQLEIQNFLKFYYPLLLCKSIKHLTAVILDPNGLYQNARRKTPEHSPGLLVVRVEITRSVKRYSETSYTHRPREGIKETMKLVNLQIYIDSPKVK